MNILESLKSYIQAFLNRVGYEAVHFTNDISSADLATLNSVRPYTVTGPLRILAMLRAAEYLEQNEIQGAIVECGVWRGGSIMAALHKLTQLRRQSREVYLCDLFESVPVDEVQSNVSQTSYPSAKLHFVSGDVRQTLPATKTGPIALLRLDTNTYESTYAELLHLYPRMVEGGVVIIDDYGHWDCARQAVDDYFNEVAKSHPLLNRIDYTGRMLVVVKQTMGQAAT